MLASSGQHAPCPQQVVAVQALLFVVAEEMRSSDRAGPSSSLLWQCGQILAAEVGIDVLKHAVLGRFNEIRPGVYREFMRVSSSTKVCAQHSQNPCPGGCFISITNWSASYKP